MKALLGRRFGSPSSQPIRCRPLRLLWLLPAIMAFDSPGCVMSREALTRFREAAIDTSVLGEWFDPEDAGSGPALSIGIGDSGWMELHSYEQDGVYMILEGYTSVIRGHRYANLQFVDADCDACSEAERAEVKADFRDEYADVLRDDPDNDCTWLIIRYMQTDDRLKFWVPESDLTDAAVDAGTLSGRKTSAGSDDTAYAPCVTSPRRRWRRFVRDNDAELFPEDLAEELVRGPVEAEH